MSNIKNFLIKIVVLTLVTGIMLTTTVSAFDITSILNGKLSAENILKKLNIGQIEIDTEDINLEELMEKFSFLQDYNYNLEDLNIDLSNMQQTGTIDMANIKELIGKLPDGFGKNILGIFSNGSGSDFNILSKLLKVVKLLLKLEDTSTTEGLPAPEDITIDATTAGDFAGDDYYATLHGNLYLNEESDNWVVLIHPFGFTGESIANKIGPYYYEIGYNILSVDLRGFGDSEGSMSMGFLDSLDVYDWLVELQKYNPKQIFIHGISLGAGTTNFVSGIDQFMEQAPADIRMNKDFKSIEDLHVVGLVVDSGFVDMTAIGASETMLLKMDVGLNEDNIEYYSQATNSLKYCKLPVLFIHGQNDSIVDFEQVEIAEKTIATPDENIRTYYPEAAHAFIVMGTNADEYKANVQEFVTDVQK